MSTILRMIVMKFNVHWGIRRNIIQSVSREVCVQWISKGEERRGEK